MKRTLLFLAMSLVFAAAYAQTPEQTAGTYYAYHAPDTIFYHAAPAGYKPFYISHYGRHGSRWMESENRYRRLEEYFSDRDNLTREGREVARKIRAVCRDAAGRAGMLTPLGAAQHREIAGRMFAAYPEVLGGSADVQARSSVVPRCVESMEAFTLRLRELNPGLRITTDARQEFMEYIAPGTRELNAYRSSVRVPLFASPDRLAAALFKDPSRIGDPRMLMLDLHTTASDMQDIPLDVDLFPIFTKSELLALYEYNNRRRLELNGDDVRMQGLAAAATVPLWDNIRDEADSALTLDHPTATLRFGHDTYLLRLLAFLQMEHPRGLDKTSPMAANLQMVFYRGGGPVLVKFILNEKEARVPVPTSNWPYYKWDDVRQYYETRVERLGHQRMLCSLNTMAGTGRSALLPGSVYDGAAENSGQTIPAVLAPNGQTFWTPQTRDGEIMGQAPYYHEDTMLQGFRASHWISGSDAQDYASFTIAPIAGNLRLEASLRATPFEHSDEISHPHYYSVNLREEHLRVEITADSHTGAFRVTPTEDGPVHIVIAVNNGEGKGSVRIDGPNHMVYAKNPVSRIYQGQGEYANLDGYLLVNYSQDPAVTGIDGSFAWLTFEGRKGRTIDFWASTSFTGETGALRNLAAEGGTFEEMASRLTQKWCDRLHRIDITSNDEGAVNQFYGAMYRASFTPREISDCDGSFPRFAYGTTMRRAGRHYMDFSLGDTYRALHPLLTIIEPELSGEMMQSLADMAYEGGWMPVSPFRNSYTSAMTGDHASSVIADAFLKGIRNFDVEKAYDGMRQNAFGTPATYEDYANGKGRRSVASYWEKGYIPLEDKVEEAFLRGGQVSRTLEYAYDDYAMSRMAEELGNGYDYRVLTRRSSNWKNVFDPFNGWVNARHEDGSFAPAGDITEIPDWLAGGASIHYSWYVPHDVQGLIRAMGGQEAFCKRLDVFFTGGYYWHGSSACHHIPYLYAMAGQPEKTRRYVRQILGSAYDNVPGGLSASEGAGQMSAWYIFSALGFYPVCPASGRYVTGTPLFEKAVLNLQNGKTFTILRDDSADEHTYLKHSDIVKGGTLRLKSR